MKLKGLAQSDQYARSTRHVPIHTESASARKTRVIQNKQSARMLSALWVKSMHPESRQNARDWSRRGPGRPTGSRSQRLAHVKIETEKGQWPFSGRAWRERGRDVDVQRYGREAERRWRQAVKRQAGRRLTIGETERVRMSDGRGTSDNANEQ
eukprot:3541824-Pleurochrysis_carterae.AAC.1